MHGCMGVCVDGWLGEGVVRWLDASVVEWLGGWLGGHMIQKWLHGWTDEWIGGQMIGSHPTIPTPMYATTPPPSHPCIHHLGAHPSNHPSVQPCHYASTQSLTPHSHCLTHRAFRRWHQWPLCVLHGCAYAFCDGVVRDDATMVHAEIFRW